MNDRYAQMKMPIDSIGTALAACGDEDQAQLLNSFGKELRVLCRSNLDMQICAISKHIDKEGEHLIRELAEFISLRNENPEARR